MFTLTFVLRELPIILFFPDHLNDICFCYVSFSLFAFYMVSLNCIFDIHFISSEYTINFSLGAIQIVFVFRKIFLVFFAVLNTCISYVSSIYIICPALGHFFLSCVCSFFWWHFFHFCGLPRKFSSSISIFFFFPIASLADLIILV